MRKSLHILILALLAFNIAAQKPQLAYERHFVKPGKILVRIVPSSKEVFDMIKNEIMRITRYEENSNSVHIVEDNYRSYTIADTARWLRIFRKDRNKAAFAYQTLFKNNVNAADKNKQEKMLYDLLMLSCDFDKDIARACGLFFSDSTTEENKHYLYKIELYTSPKTFKEILTIKINSSDLSKNASINGLNCRKKNKTIDLKWPAEAYIDSYGGYNIERSEDSIHFETINHAPVILLSPRSGKGTGISYKDSSKSDNGKYYYRVRGINFFGELSDPSNIVSSYHLSDELSPPVIDSAWLASGTVNVRWKMDVKSSGAIRKYILLRSEKDKGPYQKLLETADAVRFSDKAALPSNYYKIAAVTLNNDTISSFSRSVIIPDTVPPSAPFLISAIAEKNGSVYIKWKSNKENDIQGYKLFRKNSASNEFVQVNKKFITDTFYTDKVSLATLSRKWFYCIAASDNNFNSSSTGNIKEVIIRDTIPPSAPVLNSALPGRKGIKIKFIKSSANDINKHILLRKEDTAISTEIAVIENDDSSSTVIDSSVIAGKIYSYQMKVIDNDGNYSFSKIITVSNETGFRRKIENISYNVNRKEKNILLKWNYAENGIEKFIVYRGKENEPLTIVKTLSGDTAGWKDRTVNIGNIYEYRIKAVLTDGAESLISDAIKIIY
jgi:hypothetical protein